MIVAIAVAMIHLLRGDGRRLVLGAAATVALSCAAAQFVVAPRIERVRAGIGGAIESLPAEDPQRRAFGRLHAISVAWLGVAMLGAAAAIVTQLRTPLTPTRGIS
jgi:hypothetical protein